MPAITVRLYDGRTREQKVQFVEAVARLAIDLLDAQPGKTKVRFVEIGPRPPRSASSAGTDTANAGADPEE